MKIIHTYIFFKYSKSYQGCQLSILHFHPSTHPSMHHPFTSSLLSCPSATITLFPISYTKNPIAVAGTSSMRLGSTPLYSPLTPSFLNIPLIAWRSELYSRCPPVGVACFGSKLMLISRRQSSNGCVTIVEAAPAMAPEMSVCAADGSLPFLSL
ncbi:unnamed protein product [Closterium sp. NIES-53]